MNDCENCRDKIITEDSKQWCRYYYTEPTFECPYFTDINGDDNE
jgi:hypothetical protein